MGKTDVDTIAIEIETVARTSLTGEAIKECLSNLGWSGTTRFVKQVFGDLGIRLGYQVAASHYPGRHEGEWLYDMVWYELDGGFLVQQAMILESELKPGGGVYHAAHVDGDFQKLVQARAQVRVWFVLIPNPELGRLHIANCKRQASLFKGAALGDTYMLIVYDWTTSATSVERFTLENSPQNH